MPLIRVGTKTSIRAIIDDTMNAARLTPSWQYEVQHVESAVHLVEAGLGLTVALSFVPGPTAPNFGSGLNVNQQNVANTLVNFFNSTGGIPLAFGTLTPAV